MIWFFGQKCIYSFIFLKISTVSLVITWVSGFSFSIIVSNWGKGTFPRRDTPRLNAISIYYSSHVVLPLFISPTPLAVPTWFLLFHRQRLIPQNKKTASNSQCGSPTVAMPLSLSTKMTYTTLLMLKGSRALCASLAVARTVSSLMGFRIGSMKVKYSSRIWYQSIQG